MLIGGLYSTIHKAKWWSAGGRNGPIHCLWTFFRSTQIVPIKRVFLWWLRATTKQGREVKTGFSVIFTNLVRSLLPPATKLGQGYAFTPVCDSVHRGGGLPHCMLGYTHTHTHTHTHTWEQTPPGPEAGTPLGPGTPQHSACWEIQATSGRYASYCNAILLTQLFALFLPSAT